MPLPSHRRKPAERLLLKLTGTPTGPGLEHRVLAVVDAFLAKRPYLSSKSDRFGNRLIRFAGDTRAKPTVFTAHLDHPAFVLLDASAPDDAGRRTLTAEFRGGVADRFFPGSPVRFALTPRIAVPAEVIDIHRPEQPKSDPANPDATREPAFPVVTLTTDDERAARLPPGCLGNWALPAAELHEGRLMAPACDDLAAVAAALTALDALQPTDDQADPKPPNVAVLLTRAEEIGFIGAIAACRSRLIPKGSPLVALENSKASTDAPLGAGPIVRVGDRTSIFPPTLTEAAERAASELAHADERFVYQRKLMSGGTCEATAFNALGFPATCLCLPLANYHNMDEAAGQIGPESIAMADYHGFIRLLIAVAHARLNAQAPPDGFVKLLDELYESRHPLLLAPAEDE
ncbi:MAG: M20/M25/M40 family metallo-hydrolase [Planctomycetota bacterium]